MVALPVWMLFVLGTRFAQCWSYSCSGRIGWLHLSALLFGLSLSALLLGLFLGFSTRPVYSGNLLGTTVFIILSIYCSGVEWAPLYGHLLRAVVDEEITGI
jgi:hypothetical protein